MVTLTKAYSEGAIFTREEVAVQQKDAFERAADSLEKVPLLISVSSGAIDNIDEFTLSPIYSKLITET